MSGCRGENFAGRGYRVYPTLRRRNNFSKGYLLNLLHYLVSKYRMRRKQTESRYYEKSRVFKLEGEYPDCPYCQNTFHIANGQVDHLEPYSTTRNNKLANLLLVCSECNKSRLDSPLVYWLLNNKINPERVYWHLKARDKQIPQSMLDYLRYPE